MCSKKYFIWLIVVIFKKIVIKSSWNVIKILPFYSAVKVYKHILFSQVQPKQRTPEWFENRYSCITASSCSICKYGKHFDKKLEDYIKEKQKKYTKFISNTAIEHGVFYEDAAIKLFEKIHGVKVHESALIKHKQFPFLGASVDGLYLKYNKTLRSIIGGCIEIKVPRWRKDVTQIPYYYVDQMQMQMEVLDLQMCDHLVCKIVTIHDVDKMYENVNKDEICGVVISTESGNNYYFNKFYNFDIKRKTKFIRELIKYIKKINIDEFYNTKYYKIIDYSLVQVRRDPEWIKEYMPYFVSVYNRIIENTEIEQVCLNDKEYGDEFGIL